MKTSISVLIVAIISIIMSTFIKITTGEFFISTIFNVSGIMFSVGLGLIVTFNMNGVKNKKIIESIRTNLNIVRNSFISYFALTIFAYLMMKYLIDSQNTITKITIKSYIFELNWSFTMCCMMFFCIFYFIVNFFKIQKLNEDIYDELNK